MERRVMQRTWLRPVWISVSSVLAILGLAVSATLLLIEGDDHRPPRGPLPAIGTNADNLRRLKQTLADMGRRTVQWNTSYMNERDKLDVALLDGEVAAGVKHHIITLEIGLKQPKTTLAEIAGGAFDTQLDRIAYEMKRWQLAHPGHELILRPLHEANGDWYPWGFWRGHNGNTPARFKEAWFHIRGRMRQVFPSLPFYWCANGLRSDESDYASWYPGNKDVEYVGDDTYNRNSGEAAGPWRRPKELRARTIKEIRKLAPNKPYIVGETGTSEAAVDLAQGYTKAGWFKDFGQWLRDEASRYNIVAVSYFDYDKRPENGSDWRIFPIATSTHPADHYAQESRTAFRRAIQGIP